MCTWCWAIAAEFQKFRQKHASEIQFSLLMGGIRAGEHSLPLKDFGDSLKENWKKAEETSGQKFNLIFFERNDFHFDSEPACRAVNTFLEIYPDRVFEYKEKLEEQFYTNNCDITRAENLATIAEELGANANEFLLLFESEKLKKKTKQDFDYSDTIDVRGLPTILISRGGDPEFFCKGFVTCEEMEKLLVDYLQGIKGEAAYHPACEIGKSIC